MFSTRNHFHFYHEISEVLFDDFEGNGTINWRADALGKSIVANPFSTGNSSASVLKYDDTGGQYANIQFDADQTFDLSVNNKFTFMKTHLLMGFFYFSPTKK